MHGILVRYQRIAPLLVFAMVLAITLVGVFALELSSRAREDAQRARVATTAASALERRASINASYLRAGAALFAMQPDVSETLFRRFVEELRLDTDYRGAEGIGWAPVEPGTTGAEGARLPVQFLHPDTVRNRFAAGFDMNADPVRRVAMREAVQSVRPTASGRVVLVDEGARGAAPGFLIFMPVFDSSGPAQRLRGFIFSPYSAVDFLRSATEGSDLDGMRLELFDGPQGRRALMGTVAGEHASESGRQTLQPLRLANREMMLRVTSARDAPLSLVSLLTLLFGLLVGSLLMLVSRLLTKQLIEDQRALAWFAEQNSIRNSLTRELNHRVKNTLANVLSIATLTRRRATSLEEYAEGLEGRIRALSATHDLLTQSEWSTMPICAVVEAELAPYIGSEEGAVDIDGPTVELAPNDALSLGLALHELATNAAKYGALSVAGGRVAIRWEPIGPNLARLDWTERGGPPVSDTRVRGFGTDLIEKIVAHELRHPVDLRFEREGVYCSLRVPIRQPSDFALRARKAAAAAAAKA